MQHPLSMPSKDELAELSHAELNARIQLAFDQWMQAVRQGQNAAEKKAIHAAYDNEQLNRLNRVKKYNKYYEE